MFFFLWAWIADNHHAWQACISLEDWGFREMITCEFAQSFHPQQWVLSGKDIFPLYSYWLMFYFAKQLQLEAKNFTKM